MDEDLTKLAPVQFLKVLGVKVSRVDYSAAVDLIIAAANQRRSLGVTALAVHGVMEAHRDRAFAETLNRLDLVTPDCQPVRWAMNLLGARVLKDRGYGPTLMFKVCERAAAEGLPIFLYGSTQKVLDGLTRRLTMLFPRLIIAGVQADRFRDATTAESAQDVQAIEKSGARIGVGGRGCLRQEK